MCHDVIKHHVEMCNPEKATFLKKQNAWIGYNYEDSNSSYLVYHNCPYDYCEPPLMANISLIQNSSDRFDVQCAYNCIGLLCRHYCYTIVMAMCLCLTCPPQANEQPMHMKKISGHTVSSSTRNQPPGLMTVN